MRVKTWWAGLVLLFGCWAAPLLAEPLDARQVPADAKWYIHLDFDAARQTELFQQLLVLARAQAPVEEIQQQIKAMIGVNPLTDISSITVFSTCFGKDIALLMVRAQVDKDVLQRAAARQPQYKQENDGKHILHTWTDPRDGRMRFGAFHEPNIVLLSEKKELIRTALEVLDGTKPGGCALVKSQGGGAFLYASADLAQSNDKNLSQLLSNSEAATASAAESQGKLALSLTLTARTPEQADQLKKLADGLQALATLAARESPAAAKLLARIQTAMDGNKVLARFEHDSRTLLKTLQEVAAEAKARHAAQQQRTATRDSAK